MTTNTCCGPIRQWTRSPWRRADRPSPQSGRGGGRPGLGSSPTGPGPGGRRFVAVRVRYCREPPAMVQPSQPGVPGMGSSLPPRRDRAGACDRITGLARPAHVVGFPLSETPLNTRFVACVLPRRRHRPRRRRLARHAIDTRIYVVGFTAVTSLLLVATSVYWSTYHRRRHPVPWVVSYVIEPVLGVVALCDARPVASRSPRPAPAEPGLRGAGGGLRVLGVILAAAPGTAVRHWPWKLTRGPGPHVRGDLLAFALGAALAALERRRRPCDRSRSARSTLVVSDRGRLADPHATFEAGAVAEVWGSRARGRDRRPGGRGVLVMLLRGAVA